MSHNFFSIFASLIFGACLLASSQCFAAPKAAVARDGEVIDSVGSGAIDDVSAEVQNYNGISYITGGVGDEELAVLKAQEEKYNVRLLFKAKNGEYMGEISLKILDAKGEQILSVSDAGPYFYINLPVGKYNVEAVSSKGALKKAKIAAAAKPPVSSAGNVHVIFNE